MTSARPEPRTRGRVPRLLLPLFLFLPWLAVAAVDAPRLQLPPAGPGPEAWLITVAPGDIYWQRFGHNALWLRDPEAGLDHTFNFGYFDFEQEDFFLRFLTGRMLYQSLAFDARSELAGYAAEGRAIRAQRLDLDDTQYARLRDHLLWHVQPANRDYLYDYYLDNCSTRIRDAIDGALGGALSSVTQKQPAQAGFRVHTNQSTRMTFWYYLGLETVLGRPVDRSISRWDEMFLPRVVAETVSGFPSTDGSGPLVTADHVLFAGASKHAAPASVPAWLRYLGVSALLIVLAGIVSRGRVALRQRLARAWLGLAGVLGMMIVLLWMGTDHRVVGPNANLLLLNPLFLFVLGQKRVKLLSALVVFGGIGALAQWWLLGWQYNLDVVALAWPLSLAAALALRSGTRVQESAG